MIRHAVNWHLDIQFYILNSFSNKMSVSLSARESFDIIGFLLKMRNARLKNSFNDSKVYSSFPKSFFYIFLLKFPSLSINFHTISINTHLPISYIRLLVTQFLSKICFFQEFFRNLLKLLSLPTFDPSNITKMFFRYFSNSLKNVPRFFKFA